MKYVKNKCFQEEDVVDKCRTLKDVMPTEQVNEYLLNNWCNDNWGPLWSNYGRHFFHEDHETNNLVERLLLI